MTTAKIDTGRQKSETFVLHENPIARNNVRKSTMSALASPPTVKVIGNNGQISLGKQFAGRQVLVEEQEPGVWLVRTATVIPDNERWLHEGQAAADLQRAMAWSASHVAQDDDTDAQLDRLAKGKAR